MEPNVPGYLSLTELLDQDLSAYEFFQTLPPKTQSNLRRYHSDVDAFDELQSRAARMNLEGPFLW